MSSSLGQDVSPPRSRSGGYSGCSFVGIISRDAGVLGVLLLNGAILARPEGMKERHSQCCDGRIDSVTML